MIAQEPVGGQNDASQTLSPGNGNSPNSNLAEDTDEPAVAQIMHSGANRDFNLVPGAVQYILCRGEAQGAARFG